LSALVVSLEPFSTNKN